MEAIRLQNIAKMFFQKHIIQECEKYSVKRIDIVWDVYKDGSIKDNTRELRGPGTRRQAMQSATLPKIWSNFLNNSENKSNLFELLARDITTFDIDNTEVFSTYKNRVLRANKSTNTLLLDCK